MGTKNGANQRYLGILVAIAAVVLITAGILPFRENVNSTTVSLIFLLLVTVVATIFESAAALVASVLAAFSFNFFFLPPYYTLTIDQPDNWASLVVFLAVAVTVGELSAKASRRRAVAERLYRELNEAFEKASEAKALERSEKLKSALLDAVTHDFRTPLTSIKASVTMLIEENLREPNDSAFDTTDRGELLEVINEEADRLNTFVESMVELARIQSGDADLRRSTASAEEIVVKAARRASALRSSHKLKSDIEPGLPLLSVNPRAIVEAVYNLLNNASRYSPPRTTIHIGASRSEAGVRFSVEDEGPGIPEERRELVFERFYRSDRSEKGLGLGLAIVRGIIEGHGGRIWIESGKTGARFVFDLPASVNERQEKNPRG